MVEVVLPQWGMSMTEGTVVQWFQEEGAELDEGDDLLEVESAKTLGTIPMPEKGRLVKILVPADVTVPVLSVLAIIEPTS